MELKGLHKVKRRLADGSVRHHYYAWRGGPKLKEPFGTQAFAAEFFRLRNEEAKAAAGIRTLDDLIDDFTGPEDHRSVQFRALADTTQTDHLYAFKLIKAEWPSLPLKLTQQRGMKAMIRKWHHSFAANPRKADKLLFSLSKVFSYGISEEIIDKNPCTGITRLYSGSRKDTIWSDAQIALMQAKGQPHIVLPFLLALMTGQRQNGVLALSWSDYDGTHLNFRPSKGSRKRRVRVHSRLKAELDRCKLAMQGKKIESLRICTNSRGRPWTKDGFKTSWGKERDRLGIEGVTFHDLRGTFITLRRREGASAAQIASVTGHSIKEVNRVLEAHYLAEDQETSDAVIVRMERTSSE